MSSNINIQVYIVFLLVCVENSGGVLVFERHADIVTLVSWQDVFFVVICFHVDVLIQLHTYTFTSFAMCHNYLFPWFETIRKETHIL